MKIRILTAALAAIFMLPFMGTVAYAGGGEYYELEVCECPAEDPPPAPVIEEPTTNPFTPAGTGTVVDNATNEDGKEFFTIMTPDENVFYLIIDRQRSTENVYFLSAVTEADLLSLAKLPERPAVTPTPEPTTPEPTEPEPPTPEKSANGGMIFLLVAVVLIGGGAGWYFKIYRPKHQQADDSEDIDEGEFYDGDEPGGEDGDDGPPWYEDEGETADSEGDGE